ncbi:hypothetical protein WICPIJ_008265 [Wickerhamomyces pijperi]|uniref:Uncharacterized protein n=1 Tax=Wickerhamomyces pijperi TaxID=599730 RepID=A0A9P8TJ21_WICPI|nr:hypothetical protein WICPIJ_008265 [Wickerhamomyces pijperi]
MIKTLQNLIEKISLEKTDFADNLQKAITDFSNVINQMFKLKPLDSTMKIDEELGNKRVETLPVALPYRVKGNDLPSIIPNGDLCLLYEYEVVFGRKPTVFLDGYPSLMEYSEDTGAQYKLANGKI